MVFLTHNDISLVSKFLSHYRRLGVTRFICVDDASSDGTRDYLLDEKDTDVWISPVRYREARRGRAWRETLFAHYGINRWYLNCDSDEFLVYDNCFQKSVGSLIQYLETQGLKRLAAPMLDMYPGKEARFDDLPIESPWDYSRYFDAAGYTISSSKRGIMLTGGPRQRRFNEAMELMKYPLIYWDKNCLFGSSIHYPLPYSRNFSSVWGVLLHFKFFSNYKEKISEAAKEKQHFDQSKYYQQMMEEVDRLGEIDLQGESSTRLADFQQLIDLRFMTPIDFESR